AKALSGLTSGALSGDRSWVVRGELGRPFNLPIQNSGGIVTPYVFVATGERFLEQPTAVEIASVHATNYGLGARFNLAPWTAEMPDAYGFIEWSRITGNGRTVTENSIDGYRLFTGLLVRY